MYYSIIMRMNQSVGQTNRVDHEAVPRRVVCTALRFIPHEPRKKTLIPYIYNAFIIILREKL